MALPASLCVCKMNVVFKKMFFVVWVPLEALVVLNTFEHYLAEAIKVCNIDHLGIDNLAHQCARRALVVNLGQGWG